ncbi:uncharacterized protein LOC123260594 [Cotesia glomerata]|uniref:uncharacterized protein LOC123260594 n=1 Tax=Cotesia glomerata TaxID=32391 RepID=UPI001D023F4D|nr:uncharacterized protein LOC123260594 [Cotesia glomerata]
MVPCIGHDMDDGMDTESVNSTESSRRLKRKRTEGGEGDMEHKLDLLLSSHDNIVADFDVFKLEVAQLIKDEIKREIQAVRNDVVNDVTKAVTNAVRKELVEMNRNAVNVKTSADIYGSRLETFASKVKQSQIERITVEPKEKQDIAVTVQKLKKSVDVGKLGVGVDKLEKTRSGNVIIGCKQKEDSCKLFDELKKSIGNEYNIKINEKKMPKIKIIDIEEEIISKNNDEIIKTLQTQNDLSQEVNTKMEIKKKAFGKNKEGFIILEVDPKSHKQLNELKEVEESEIDEIIKKLDKNKGKGSMISNDIIDKIWKVDKVVIREIVNCCLKSSKIPDNWKNSLIHPIPKVKGTNNAEDFRPINTLPELEKIVEQVVKNRLLKHLDRNGILKEEQSGFRKHHSCETALQKIMCEWRNEIDKGNMIGAVLLDLSKAFETLNIPRLIEKPRMYGVGGGALEWFQNYLEDRTQQVKFGDAISVKIKVKYGVPQGSILGPLLFILYINDIVDVAKEYGCQLPCVGHDMDDDMDTESVKSMESSSSRRFKRKRTEEEESDIEHKLDLLLSIHDNIEENNDVFKMEVKQLIKDEIKREIQAVRKDIVSEVTKSVTNAVRKELLELNRNTVTGKVTSDTYAGRLKKSQMESIIVEPKAKQDTTVTVQKLKKSVDVGKLGLGVDKINETKSGKVIIGCKQKQDSHVLVEELKKNIGNEYNIKLNDKKLPKLKIIDIEEDIISEKREKEIIKIVQKQNDLTLDQNSKIEIKKKAVGKKKKMVLLF